VFLQTHICVVLRIQNHNFVSLKQHIHVKLLPASPTRSTAVIDSHTPDTTLDTLLYISPYLSLRTLNTHRKQNIPYELSGNKYFHSIRTPSLSSNIHTHTLHNIPTKHTVPQLSPTLPSIPLLSQQCAAPATHKPTWSAPTPTSSIPATASSYTKAATSAVQAPSPSSRAWSQLIARHATQRG
jgi:hypothetical protein